MIGILTFFDCFNYGTFLQAYALNNYLAQKGYKSEFINYRTEKSQQNEYQVTLYEDSKGDPVTWLKIFIKIIKFRAYHRKLPKTKRFYKREELASQHYNIIIVGSDQIWCYSKEWGGVDTPYFSDQLNANKLIAYAASMGPDKFDQQHPRSILRLMKNFHHIAVRDSNTFNFAKLSSPLEPQLVLDPTFLYDFSKERKETRLRNYILFYSDVLIPPQDVIDGIKDIARKNNLKIVSIGKKFDWCDDSIITPSPFRWLGYIKNANFIVTCMYHGLLFSVQNKKQFAMFLIPERENKCLDFLNRIGLANRVIKSGAMAKEIFETPINYAPVDEFIEKERKASEAFLMKVLQ